MDGIESPNRVTFSRPWTARELAELRRLAPLGAEECARRLGRSVHSVKCAARRHGISLRPPGEPRGRLLGQRRGQRLEPEQRAALLRVRPEVLEAWRELRAGRGLLCPGCGYRPASRPDGLCSVCHERALADAAMEELARAEEERRRWRARQRLHRERERLRREREGAA